MGLFIVLQNKKPIRGNFFLSNPSDQHFKYVNLFNFGKGVDGKLYSIGLKLSAHFPFPDISK